MLVDATVFQSFMQPRRVGDPVTCTLSFDIIRASVRRRWDAYQKLREVKGGVLTLTEITATPEEVFFEVAPSANYDGIKLAVARDLVWSTRSQSIDYARSIERWCDMLEHEEVLVEVIDRMRANDLDDPVFGDFKITLMEYLISCERRGGTYYRITGFKAIKPSD